MPFSKEREYRMTAVFRAVEKDEEKKKEEEVKDEKSKAEKEKAQSEETQADEKEETKEDETKKDSAKKEEPKNEDKQSYIVEGYATTFDEAYSFEGMPGEYETVLHDAFDDCDMSDAIFQFDHCGMVMARVRNESLTLTCDEHGLLVRADLSGTEQGRQLYEAVKNGLIDRMSWGFMIADDGYAYDYETHTATISKVAKVYDVSAVSIPANQGTEIYARSARLDGEIKKARKEFARRAAARKALALKAKAMTIH